MIPRSLLIPIGGAVALLLAVLWHSGQVSQVKRDAYAAGVAAATKAIDEEQAKADRIATEKKVQTEAKADTISKEKTDALLQDHRAINARAVAIGVRHAAAQAQRDRAPGDQSRAGETAPGTAPTPPCDGLPWGVALPLLTQAALDRAQLDAILDWEDAQDALEAEAERDANTQTQ